MTATKYILGFEGLRAVIDGVESRCEPSNGFQARINNMIYNAMRTMKVPMVQFAPSLNELPIPGTPNQIYLVLKNPQYASNFIAYTYDAINARYVQVGSSIFQEEVEPDHALNINSTRAIDNAAFTAEWNKKYDADHMVHSPIADSDYLVTSAGIYEALSHKLNDSDAHKITKYQLRSAFFNEYTNGGYLYVNLRFYPKDFVFKNDTSYKPGISELNFTTMESTIYGSTSYGNNPAATISNGTHIFHDYPFAAGSNRYHCNITVSPDGNTSYHYALPNITGPYGYAFAGFDDPLEITILFRDKIPLKTLMDAHLRMRSTILSGVDHSAEWIRENAAAGVDINPLPVVYATIKVSGDGTNWFIWKNDQQEYRNDPDTQLFDIPIFE